MEHPVYARESDRYKRRYVDDRESYTKGFRRMNGISPFPLSLSLSLPTHPSNPSIVSLHDGTRQPSPPRTIYQYPFVLLLLYIYARAVRSRWKNTDHFLAFSVGQRHFTDIFHPFRLFSIPHPRPRWLATTRRSTRHCVDFSDCVASLPLSTPS